MDPLGKLHPLDRQPGHAHGVFGQGGPGDDRLQPAKHRPDIHTGVPIGVPVMVGPSGPLPHPLAVLGPRDEPVAARLHRLPDLHRGTFLPKDRKSKKACSGPGHPEDPLGTSGDDPPPLRDGVQAEAPHGGRRGPLRHRSRAGTGHGPMDGQDVQRTRITPTPRLHAVQYLCKKPPHPGGGEVEAQLR